MSNEMTLTNLNRLIPELVASHSLRRLSKYFAA
jgi:hypothetical protein